MSMFPYMLTSLSALQFPEDISINFQMLFKKIQNKLQLTAYKRFMETNIFKWSKTKKVNAAIEIRFFLFHQKKFLSWAEIFSKFIFKILWLISKGT